MRIIVLTAGTGSFHCGTCIRDNALVRELRRQGHDALLVPMYLAPILDEESTLDDSPLFFGGINVYLQHKSALFRHTPRWLDKLLDSPALLRAAAQRAGMTSARDLGELTVSMLRGEEGNQVKEVERLAEWVAQEGRPDVVCLSHALLLGVARRIRERTGARVACFLNGEDGFLDSLGEPYAQQCWSLVNERAGELDALIATSRYYADVMIRRAPKMAARMHVVYPGIDLTDYRKGLESEPSDQSDQSDTSDTSDGSDSTAAAQAPVLGYLARLSPVKGMDTLVEAWLLLRERNRIPGLKLRAAGTMTAADEAFLEEIKLRASERGLAGDLELLPNVDHGQKISHLRGLSVFSMPATYGESFGLPVIEAMAAGAPVVQPDHAAFPEIIEATGGGLLCAPDDPSALADAIERLLLNAAEARALGERGRASVFERFSIEASARETLRVLEGGS